MLYFKRSWCISITAYTLTHIPPPFPSKEKTTKHNKALHTVSSNQVNFSLVLSWKNKIKSVISDFFFFNVLPPVNKLITWSRHSYLTVSLNHSKLCGCATATQPAPITASSDAAPWCQIALLINPLSTLPFFQRNMKQKGCLPKRGLLNY